MKFEELNLPTIWTQIKGYTNYQISICGQVKNITTNKILKNSKSNTGYFVVTLSKDNQDKKYLIHRLVALNFIPNINKSKYVDHIDSDRLNNTISNLRWCTNQENCFNRSVSKNSTSGHKGVSWRKDKNKWRAHITLNNKYIHLGHFSNIQDAINARKKKAHELFGEFVNDCEK